MDYTYYAFIILGFIAVVLLIEGLYLIWNSYKGPEARRIEKRLRAISAGARGDRETFTILKERLISQAPKLEQALLRLPRARGLDRLLVQSGVKWSVANFFGLSLACAMAGLLLAVFFKLPWWVAITGALAASILPLLYVLRERRQRLVKIEEQLPEALDLISRAMRAGHAFPSALKMVGEEMTDPIAGEFRLTHDEINFGVALPDALMNFATRVPSMDLRYFVIAVLIQRETGGNLTEVLGNISNIIRERLKLLGKVRVLSAEGRLSAWILSLLPFAVAVVINIVNPKFLAVLYTDPLGIRLVSITLAMIAVGIFAMWRIIDIRV